MQPKYIMSNRTYQFSTEDALKDILDLIETAQHSSGFKVHLPQEVIDELQLEHQYQY